MQPAPESPPRPYWERLDHLRGVAAFLVFAWHFVHFRGIVSSADASWLSVVEEGHTGVSLFMALSGYLFAKITGDRRIDVRRFLEARILRLGPMLALALLAAYALHPERWYELPLGLVAPVWDNGCWSVAVELQFYLLLPLLLGVFRRAPAAALAVIATALLARWALYAAGGDLQTWAYYSLLGRLDQFVAGIFAWRLAQGRRVPNRLFVLGFGAFLAAFHGFNLAGGMAGTADSPLWIWEPAVEGLGWSLLIAWYDGGRWSLPRPFAFVGKVSYSMYLIHILLVGAMAELVQRWFHPQGFYPTLVFAVPAFALLLPFAWATWRVVELPPMRLRRSYLLADREPAASGPKLSDTLR